MGWDAMAIIRSRALGTPLCVTNGLAFVFSSGSQRSTNAERQTAIPSASRPQTHTVARCAYVYSTYLNASSRLFAGSVQYVAVKSCISFGFLNLGGFVAAPNTISNPDGFAASMPNARNGRSNMAATPVNVQDMVVLTGGFLRQPKPVHAHCGSSIL